MQANLRGSLTPPPGARQAMLHGACRKHGLSYIEPGTFKEPATTLLRLQFDFPPARGAVILVTLLEDQTPRTVPLGLAMFAGVVLLQPVLWILADSDVEAPPGLAPQHVQKIRLSRNSAHKKRWAALARGPELWLRGRDLNPRSRRAGL